MEVPHDSQTSLPSPAHPMLGGAVAALVDRGQQWVSTAGTSLVACFEGRITLRPRKVGSSHGGWLEADRANKVPRKPPVADASEEVGGRPRPLIARNMMLVYWTGYASNLVARRGVGKENGVVGFKGPRWLTTYLFIMQRLRQVMLRVACDPNTDNSINQTGTTSIPYATRVENSIFSSFHHA